MQDFQDIFETRSFISAFSIFITAVKSSTFTCGIVGGGSFSIFRKISPPISIYYDPSLIKNFCKTTNPPSLIKATPFCAYDLTGRYNSVFFKLTPLPLIPVEDM